MGENHFAKLPVALYGLDLLLCGTAYYILERALISRHGAESKLGKAIGKDHKGLTSLFTYAAAIPIAFVNSWISVGLYALIAGIWIVPDRRIEKHIVD